MASNDGWEDVSHELDHGSDGWEDVSHELKKTTALDAFHKNASDTALMGYAPQVRAGVIDPIVEKIGNLLTGDNVDMGDYIANRDAYRKEIETSKKEHPDAALAGSLTGAAATALVPGMNAAKGATAGARILNAARTGAAMGAIANPGDKEGEISGLQLPERIENAAMGAGTGAALQGVGEGVNAIVSKGGKALKSAAEALAEKATGATAKQAEKFRQGAGRELLDRGLVQFGDTPENIAQRVGGAVDSANSQIDSALSQLDAKGVQASADNVVAELQNRISELKKDPSQAGTVRKLETIIDDIISTGQSKVPISLGEQTKRGFNKAAGNWMDPEAGQAGKAAYQAYKGEVETAANAADPALAKMFKEGKDTYGLLAPIQEAAERRATQLQQSPLGGLGDWAAAGAGGATAGPGGSAIGLAAKKVLAPRAASAMAVSADKASQFLLSQPRFAQMAQENPKAFATAVQALANNPKFQSSANPQPMKNPIIDRISTDPSKMDVLKNDRLKDQLKKQMEQRKIKGNIPVQEAQASFVDGN